MQSIVAPSGSGVLRSVVSDGVEVVRMGEEEPGVEEETIDSSLAGVCKDGIGSGEE